MVDRVRGIITVGAGQALPGGGVGQGPATGPGQAPRPLNAPRRIEVREDTGGIPVAVRLVAGVRAKRPRSSEASATAASAPGRHRAGESDKPHGTSGRGSGSGWLAIVEITGVWRLDDEWWHERPLSRMYYQVVLEDGMALSLFKDLVSEKWYRQEI